MMTCRSDYYKEDQPTGWPSLSMDAMPNRSWETLRGNRNAQRQAKGRNDIAAY